MEQAIETLQKSSEKQSDKLDKLNDNVVAGRTLLKAFAWLIPIVVAILTVLIQVVFHFWK